MDRKIRVVVIDDHPLMRIGISLALGELSSSIEIVGSGGSASEAIALSNERQPDVILMDVGIPGGGLDATADICSNRPTAKIIILTVSERAENVVKAFQVGASAYVLKGIDTDELKKVIVSVSNGNTYVSPELAGKILSPSTKETTELSNAESRLRALNTRELEILELLNRGNSNKDIASQLEIGEKTVKYYLTTIFGKLAVKNRLEAVVFFRNTSQKIELDFRH